MKTTRRDFLSKIGLGALVLPALRVELPVEEKPDAYVEISEAPAS